MENYKQGHLRELANSFWGTEYKKVVSSMRSTIVSNIDDKTSETNKKALDKSWRNKNNKNL